MSWARLCLRNLWYHGRGNFAVFLGVVVGTTVLTGALLVGDSLRGSLRDLTLERLGWVDEALIAPRFFRESLARGLYEDNAVVRITPVILLKATAVAGTNHARGITVIGVAPIFWDGPLADQFRSTRKRRDEAWVNSTLAHDLGVTDAGSIILRLQKPSAVPREALLAKRDDRSTIDEWSLHVGKVLAPNDFGDRFNLRPEIEAPRTVFVPIEQLQERLGLEDRCNALLAAGDGPNLPAALRLRLDLEDWGLVLRSPEERVAELFRKLDRNRDYILQPREWRGKLAEAIVHAIDPKGEALSSAAVQQFYRKERNYLSLESRQLLIPPDIARKVAAAAEKTNLRSAPTLVYLANTIAAGGKEIPYSVVAALDPALAPPLGPFLPPGAKELGEDDIVLADWKQSPLPRDMKPGETVTLSYFPPEHHGDLREQGHRFRFAGLVPLAGPSGDPDLTPEFPGITDKLEISKWDPPFPYDNSRIQPRDDRYWKDYRTTPKAYVALATGQKLWGSRFGDVTAFRLAPREGNDLAAAEQAFRKELRAKLASEDQSFQFQPVKLRDLAASGGSSDFGMLFLGFSFFLIAAALLLVGLLFRLNLERRATEVGLLAAVGFRQRALQSLLLAEGAVVALLGTAVGTVVAIAYAELPLRLLEALWPGGALRTVLRPHPNSVSLSTGAGASFLVSILTIAWGTWAMGRVPPRALLAGQGHVEKISTPGRRRWGWLVVIVALLGAVALLAVSGQVHDPEMRAMTFFGSGSLLLTACLVAVAAWMRGTRHRTVSGHGWWSVARLGIRNAARNPGRSLLTCGLLAAAAFLLVAVEAFRRRADIDVYDLRGPSGGFSLVAESDLPVYLDLNSEDGRTQVLRHLEQAYQDQKLSEDEIKQRLKSAEELLEQTQFFALRVHAGDDVSCLNLYQPRQPRLLGVPESLINRGGFLFAATDRPTTNPWLLLHAGKLTNALGEKNTVEWILKSDIGKSIVLPNGWWLDLVGLLQDSVFQSSLLISEEEFLRMFPDHEGYNFFLIAPPRGREADVKQLLDTGLADRGLETTPVVDRIAAYMAVENMYLSTFQALGGLGLVLGSLGLAVVLLRGVWERRAELALLRALGYRRIAIGWLVLSENAFLLLLGLAAGTLSALAAVAPHLLGGGVPWWELIAMLAAVIVVGLLAETVATASTLRAPLVPALRRE
jgi:ABC-type lipoprotein release transport system permease subunit